MKTLKAATLVGAFNQRLQTRHSNKRFPYSRPYKHEYDRINNFFSSVQANNITYSIELVVVTKTLLTDVYAIGSKSGLNIDKFFQEHFRERGITMNI